MKIHKGSHFSSCMQPSGWLVVLAEWHPRSQVANEGHCSTEARVPARESWAVIAGICHQLHKVGKVDLSNLQTVDHELHGTVPSLIETTQFTVELTKTFCLWGSNTFLFSNNHWVDQLKESASGLIMMKFPGISSELRAVSVSFLILWLISGWARERQKPYFCWNWF